jgi:hypothetical protein
MGESDPDYLTDGGGIDVDGDRRIAISGRPSSSGPIAEGLLCVVRRTVLRIQHQKVDKKEGSTVVPQ